MFGDSYAPEDGEKRRQSSLSARLAVGKMLGGRHILKVHAGYTGVFGAKALADYEDNTLMAGLRYGISGRRLEFLSERTIITIAWSSRRTVPHYVFPYMRMTWKNTSEGFVPYVEVDGGLRRHDYGSLMYENPYMLLADGDLLGAASLPNELLL